uniref:Uncharacterized protein n=1 Tax=Cacopsylla melanoneura TaxID=428564 RepID=A0A8D9AF83_9HEMI
MIHTELVSLFLLENEFLIFKIPSHSKSVLVAERQSSYLSTLRLWVRFPPGAGFFFLFQKEKFDWLSFFSIFLLSSLSRHEGPKIKEIESPYQSLSYRSLNYRQSIFFWLNLMYAVMLPWQPINNVKSLGFPQ